LRLEQTNSDLPKVNDYHPRVYFSTAEHGRKNYTHQPVVVTKEGSTW